MTGRARGRLVAAFVFSFVGLIASPASSQFPQLDEATAAREQKAREIKPHQRSKIERALFTIEDDLLVERVLNPPRGIYLRIGNMGEGAGFSVGPAFRYNTHRFDFRTSAAASTRTYFISETSLRFPGTIGQDDYFKSDGFYVELQARRRVFPQEDFYGLGTDSELSDRSNFAVRDTLGRVVGGFDRGLFRTGLGVGYLDVSAGAGTDRRMPSSTDLFSADELPGIGDRGGFAVIEPFVEYATLDPVVEDYSGGRYRLSMTEYRDRRHDRYSFRRVDADARQYVTFVKGTRTLAFRAWAASTFADEGNEVPFYLQPTLGGGRTLRGFRTFRFRDRAAVLLQGEYRWRINEFVQGALFYDTGAIGAALDELGGFERSYGFGLRAGGRTGSAFRIEMAFGGREGHRLLVRFDDAF